jgi:ubiquinone/menaquinone biosynthesis C-methylase UbiE
MEMTDDPNKLEEEFSDTSGIDRRNTLQEAHGTHPRSWSAWLFDRIHPLPDARILDIGCGTGDFWVENHRRIWDSWRIILGDNSAAMVREAAARLQPYCPTCDPLLLDAQMLPFPPLRFDMVVAIGLFDILPDPPRAIREAARVLRPGGRLYATAGGSDHLAEFEELLQPLVPGVQMGGLPERFGLDNGVELLSPWFESFEVAHYADRLVFEQPEPVLEYLLSEDSIASDLEGERLSLLRERIERRLQRGPFEVRREKGVIVGQRRLVIET